MRAAVATAPADRRSVELGRSTMTVLAQPAETDGRHSLYRFALQPGSGGPAPHVHPTLAESFVVLDGLVELYDGRGWRLGRPGDHLYVEEGVVHAFRHTDAAPAAVLMLSAPAAPREECFFELADLPAAPAPTAADFVGLWARHDTSPRMTRHQARGALRLLGLAGLSGLSYLLGQRAGAAEQHARR